MSDLPDRIMTIDGGFSTQLAFHVGSNIDGDPLWSARYNAVEPTAVIQTHLDFLENGAEIILTNTYQASVEGYTTHLKLDREQSIELIKSTVKLAHIARDKFLQTKGNQQDKPLIFASIGPYGAHLHDGSEYTGSYASRVSSAVIRKWHKVRIDACVEAGVDGLAIETIPCQMEAEAVVDLIHDEYPDLKFWVSFQCKDGQRIADGGDFSSAVEMIWSRVEARQKKNLIAIGVNCINPNYVAELFKSLKRKIPLVVYPNSGEIYSVEEGWKGEKDCLPLEEYVHEWASLGAKFIGGCCRTNASMIQKLRQKVDQLN